MPNLRKVSEIAVLIVLVGGFVYMGVSALQRDHLSTSGDNAQLARNLNKDIAVCIIDPKIQANPVYHNLPTLTTHLTCDGAIANNGKTTLTELYENKWSLIQMIDPSIMISVGNNNRRAYPALYLERYKSKKK